MGRSPQSSAIFARLLILGVAHKIIVFISHCHSLPPLIWPIVPTWRTKVTVILRLVEWARQQNICKLDGSDQDDQCRKGPWEARMYQTTPDWNVNLSNWLLIKERHHISLYEEWIFFSLCMIKYNTRRNSGIFKRRSLYKGCTKGNI